MTCRPLSMGCNPTVIRSPISGSRIGSNQHSAKIITWVVPLYAVRVQVTCISKKGRNTGSSSPLGVIGAYSLRRQDVQATIGISPYVFGVGLQPPRPLWPLEKCLPFNSESIIPVRVLTLWGVTLLGLRGWPLRVDVVVTSPDWSG